MEITRRYDIDWLRVIAIGLLLIYHIAIVFQPWGIFIGFIQSDESLEGLWVAMAMLNVWRIPLLFFVSGMGICFAFNRRSVKQLLLERARRILMPLLFGMLAIVPTHIFILQMYYGQTIQFLPSPGHLWFLGNIFIYAVMLSPLFYFLMKKENKLTEILKRLFSHPIGLLLVIIPFAIETMVVNPETYELYYLTWHGFFLGLLAFFFGFCFVLSGKGFWDTVKKWHWFYLILALALYIVRIAIFQFKSPGYMMATETIFWVYSIFGIATRYLNRPSQLLSYLSQGAYPIYITHMIFLYLGSSLILPLDWPVIVKFVGIISFTFIGCFGSYELVIRRIVFLRPLFGLKSRDHVNKVNTV